MNSVRYIISALVILFSLTLTAQESNQLLSRDFWGQKPSLVEVKAAVSAGNDPSEANGSNFDPVVMAIFGDASEEVIDYLFAQEGNFQSSQLYNYEQLNSSFVDIFYKSRVPYLYKGEKNSVGYFLKLDNHEQHYYKMLC